LEKALQSLQTLLDKPLLELQTAWARELLQPPTVLLVDSAVPWQDLDCKSWENDLNKCHDIHLQTRSCAAAELNGTGSL
jgi:hypothetical protein